MNEPLIQLVDLLLFAGLVALAVRAFGAGGKLYPLLAAAVFGCDYFSDVPFLTMQREYFIILALVLAAALMRKPGRKGLDVFVGLLAALVFLIKPHAVIGFVWLAAIRWSDVSAFGKGAFRAVGTQALAFAGLVGATIAYLSAVGGLKPLLSIIANYLPLYGAMDGDHRISSPEARLHTLLTSEMLANDRWWLFIVAVVVAALMIRREATDAAQRRSIKLALGLTCAYWIYPALSGGQFWLYHWLPFDFSLIMLTALCFQAASETAKAEKIAVGLAGAAAFGLIAYSAAAGLMGGPKPGEDARVNQITQFLNDRLRPGDTVQPLDWTGGAVHAMLRSKAIIATPFIYDFSFYHHVSNPYIQGLRRTFISDFDKANPRFVIFFFGIDKPWPKGPETTRHFPELEQRLTDRYDVARQGDQYVILQRKGS